MSGILNAAGNFVTGASNFAGGTLAQPNVQLFGVNIPGIPLISFRDYFLTSLESWVGSIPLRTQFIAIIDRFPPGLNTLMMRSLEHADGDKKNFDIDRAKKVLTSTPLQGVVGCIFLQGADIPSENLGVETATIENNRGFIPGAVLGNRDSFVNQNLTLQFRETNTSFTDLVMRPWLIMASHHGYVARDPSNKSEALKNPKCNITLIQYSRSYQKLSMIPRKVWAFYDCVPLNLSTRNLSYDTESLESYNVPFLYSRYAIKDNLYLPLPDIIDAISNRGIKGIIPRISPFQK